jgi:exodeoxyribonuclease V alpha subunit
MKIYTEFGDETYNIIRSNPYKIADHVPGIGFKTVDGIAMQAGIATDSEFRFRSAIMYILTQATSYGHIYLPEKMLIEEVAGLINPEMLREDFDEMLHNMLLDMAMEAKIVMRYLRLVILNYQTIMHFGHLMEAW